LLIALALAGVLRTGTSRTPELLDRLRPPRRSACEEREDPGRIPEGGPCEAREEPANAQEGRLPPEGWPQLAGQEGPVGPERVKGEDGEVDGGEIRAD